MLTIQSKPIKTKVKLLHNSNKNLNVQLALLLNEIEKQTVCIIHTEANNQIEIKKLT